MHSPKRWPPEAWIPLVAGLYWLWIAGRLGLFGFALAIVPGCLMLSAGVSMLLYPGDLRIPQFAAGGGVVGGVLALPMMLAVGFVPGFLLLSLSWGSFFAAGWYCVDNEPHIEDVPPPQPSLALAAQVAIDEAILASLAVRSPMVESPDQVRGEVHQAREVFDAQGWLRDPRRYHLTPPALSDANIERRRVSGYDFEQLSFASEYEPHADEPGRERWLSYTANQTAHAWIFRAGENAASEQSSRKLWLICIHGYEMGIPRLDFPAFRVLELLPRQLNLCLPVLPLHGPRRIGRRSGGGYLAGHFLDTIHAEAQAMWDLRRMLSWIRQQGGTTIGVYGLSLGGYNAALLSTLDDDLACVIAGIPAVDLARLTWRHAPTTQIRYAERSGLVHDEVREVLQVISPLAMDCRVPRDHRYIFAGVADRLVPADQPRDLWQHWEQPRIEWYQGGHVTFRAHRGVDRLWREALRESGLISV